MRQFWQPATGVPGVGNLHRRFAGPGTLRRARTFAVLCLGSILLFPVAGCTFSTRTPEAPSVNEVPWVDPISAARALTNVQVTFSAKSANNYDRSLAGDFAFIPSEADRAIPDSPTFYDGWNKQREVTTFTAIFQQSEGTVTFTWGPPNPAVTNMLTDDLDLNGGKYYENLKYQMVFRRSGADTTISGLVNLYLREGTGGWSIYKWVDQQDGSGNATLGLVRFKEKVVY
jgi:hypothetical protein